MPGEIIERRTEAAAFRRQAARKRHARPPGPHAACTYTKGAAAVPWRPSGSLWPVACSAYAWLASPTLKRAKPFTAMGVPMAFDTASTACDTFTLGSRIVG